jgi:hypothetical protein
LAESGLTELSYFVSVMDVQTFHQTNLREIGEELSKLIIKAQTLLDNPIPIQMNELDLKAEVNPEKIKAYKEANT